LRETEYDAEDYEVFRGADGRYGIGTRSGGSLIVNDGICGYYWWNTKEEAEKALELVQTNGFYGLGKHGYGEDEIEVDEFAPEYCYDGNGD